MPGNVSRGSKSSKKRSSSSSRSRSRSPKKAHSKSSRGTSRTSHAGSQNAATASPRSTVQSSRVSPSGVQLQYLNNLKAHPLMDGSGERAGGPEFMARGRLKVSEQRPMCPQFHDRCKQTDRFHRASYMHPCPQGAGCPELRNVRHCLAYWHFLAPCAGGCQYPCPFRHECEAGLACEELANPVHQQLFEHNAEVASEHRRWLAAQKARQASAHERELLRDTIFFGRFPYSPYAVPEVGQRPSSPLSHRAKPRSGDRRIVTQTYSYERSEGSEEWTPYL